MYLQLIQPIHGFHKLLNIPVQFEHHNSNFLRSNLPWEENKSHSAALQQFTSLCGTFIYANLSLHMNMAAQHETSLRNDKMMCSTSIIAVSSQHQVFSLDASACTEAPRCRLATVQLRSFLLWFFTCNFDNLWLRACVDSNKADGRACGYYLRVYQLTRLQPIKSVRPHVRLCEAVYRLMAALS